MIDFSKMTKEEAIKYCYRHENQFKADCYASNTNGERAFDCLIAILEYDSITPSELPEYGMDYGD